MLDAVLILLDAVLIFAEAALILLDAALILLNAKIYSQKKWNGGSIIFYWNKIKCVKLSLSKTFWKFLVFWISVEFFLLGSIQLHFQPQ